MNIQLKQLKTLGVFEHAPRVFREYEIAAMHHLRVGDESHKCRRPHGHNYQIRVEVGGKLNMDAGGVVLLFEHLDDAVKPVLAELDHGNLNDTLGEYSSCEVLACYLFAQIGMNLGGAYPILRLEVRETGKSGAVIGT